MSDITFFFVVGGNINHYDNLYRCIKSIENASLSSKKFHNYLILELGDRLKSKNRIKVLNRKDLVDFSSPGKVGYKIWRQKYFAASLIETKYGIYADTDMVMANDNTEKLKNVTKNFLGVVKHFWVPTVKDFYEKAVPKDNKEIFLEIKKKLRLDLEDNFYAGGSFIFENNDINKERFSYILEEYDDFYRDKQYVPGITDELFLSAAAKKFKNVKVINGAMNHCSMGDEFMPMKIMEEKLYGKNSFEENFHPITFLHCDIMRRDPTECYEEKKSKLISNYFDLKTPVISNWDEFYKSWKSLKN